MRVRLTFAKTAAMRYTGNLDLHRTLERTFRRARLPLEYSEGFTPRPRVNLASALPLGFTSGHELADIWLVEKRPLEELADAIRSAAPPGVLVLKLEEIHLEAPKLQNVVDAAEYVGVFLDPVPDLSARVDTLLAADILPRERRGKTYDLRPLVLDLACLEADGEGRQRVWMHLAARPGFTGRADEVVAALGIDPFRVRVHRTALHLEEKSC